MPTASAIIHEFLIPFVSVDGIVKVNLLLSVLKSDDFLSYISPIIKVLGCLVVRCELHVRLHERRSRGMVLPHSSGDSVEWAHGHYESC